ncbi:hypothetical protein BaRGS_00039601, partial [Batillaria attramentaria]
MERSASPEGAGFSCSGSLHAGRGGTEPAPRAVMTWRQPSASRGHWLLQLWVVLKFGCARVV